MGDMLPEAYGPTIAEHLESQEVNLPAATHDLYKSC